jgi:hypothetical protein
MNESNELIQPIRRFPGNAYLLNFSDKITREELAD